MGRGHGREFRADNDPRRRPGDGWRTRDMARFRQLVREALVTLPEELAAAALEARVECQDVPPASPDDELRLATYVPAASGIPARLTIYRRPLESRALTRGELVQALRFVVGEEIATALGIEGWGDDWDED